MLSRKYNKRVKTLGGIWVGGKRDGFGRPSFSGSIAQKNPNCETSMALQQKFLGKRTPGKLDPGSPSIPKAAKMPSYPETIAVHLSFVPIDNHTLDEWCRAYPVSMIKLTYGLRSLSLKEILRLQEVYEGLIDIAGISAEDMGNGEDEHPVVIENNEI